MDFFFFLCFLLLLLLGTDITFCCCCSVLVCRASSGREMSGVFESWRREKLNVEEVLRKMSSVSKFRSLLMFIKLKGENRAK